MACNLNFNQCNSFSNYPQPIFNCYCKLLTLLNSSDTTVINPTTNNSNAFFVATAQSISSGGSMVVSLSSSTGSIQINSEGNVVLPTGKYLLSANISGIFPSNGEVGFAFYKDGSQISSTLNETSGNSGDKYSISINDVVNITGSSSVISLRNINNQAQTINNGTIFVQELN